MANVCIFENEICRAIATLEEYRLTWVIILMDQYIIKILTITNVQKVDMFDYWKTLFHFLYKILMEIIEEYRSIIFMIF